MGRFIIWKLYFRFLNLFIILFYCENCEYNILIFYIKCNNNSVLKYEYVISKIRGIGWVLFIDRLKL